MRIRIRAPNGAHTLDLDSTTTVADLIASIKDKASIIGDIELKIGYPPKPLPLDTYSSTFLLTDLPIKLNGEQLTVAKSANQTSSVAATHIGGPQNDDNRSRQAGPASGPLSNSSGTTFREEARMNGTTNSGFSINRIPGSDPTTSQKSSIPKPRSKRANAKAAKDMEMEPPVIAIPSYPGSSLVLRIMEDDNSCLFRAINYIFMRELDAMQDLRSMVAQTIQKDAELPVEDQQYSDAVLGQPRDKYCEWIQMENSWGGYVELVILSKYFEMEIWSIDVSSGRIDRYNTGAPKCGIVVYSGIHYDALAMTPIPYASEADQTVFDVVDEAVEEAAVKLVKVLQQRNYFTDTAKFTLKCNDCGKGLVGERGAMEHAGLTGHTNFAQYQE